MRSLALILGALFALVHPACAQEPERQPPAGMVGVLRWPGLFGADPCDPTPAKPVPIFASPRAKVPIGTLELVRAAKPEPEGGCSSGRVVGLRRYGAPQAEALPTIEIEYEQPAAIAIARSGPWCQLLLRSGSAWVHESCETGFISLEALWADKPWLYLLEGAIEQARSQPGNSGQSLQIGDRAKAPALRSAHVLGRRIVDGQTWLRLAASGVKECERSPLPDEVFELWLPLRNAAGRPNLWFHARGC